MNFSRIITPLIFVLVFLGCKNKKEDFQLTDYHVHLKGDFTYDKALEKSKKEGINYGIAVNCGIGFPVNSDSAALTFFDQMKGSPFYIAMQAEGREWLTTFSPEVINKFDYVFTDALTWTDHKGRRMRLWMPDEVYVDDEQQFMDMYVDKIVEIISSEPIDIFVNPTFLPEVIRDDYDRLWTEKRMQKVIDAAVQHNVAIEINDRYEIPGQQFIALGKSKGLKFACGTNNKDSNFGGLNYCKEMIKAFGLEEKDFFEPEVKKTQI